MKQVSQSQLYMLFSHFHFASTLIFVMSTLIGTAQYMAWLALILGAMGGLVITYLNYRLANKRPTQFFAHFGKDIIGKWLHYPLSLMMVIYFLFTGAYIFRGLQDFIMQIYLPGTPAWAISGLFGICLIYAVRSGVVTIFRSAQGIFYSSVLGFLLVPLFLKNEMNFSMAIALLNHFELKGLWNGTISIVALFGEMAMILILFPYFTNHGKTMRSLIWATATSVCIILANLVPMIMIFGPKLSANLIYAESELIRFIPTGSFFENLDPFLIAIWFSTVFIKICLFLYVAINLLTHTFALTDHKPFSLSMTVVMLALSTLMAHSQSEMAYLLNHGGYSLNIFFQCIPILYLVVDGIRTYRSKA